jgi:hypothetical protein
MYDYIEILIDRMKNKTLWDISIGPSGINIQVGKEIKNKNDILSSGEISLWLQCDVKILSVRKEVFFSIFPQGREELAIFKKYLEGKKVIDTSLIKHNNSLKIKLESNITLQIYPQAPESEKCWIVYDNQISNPTGIIVFYKLIKPSDWVN